MQKCQPSDCCFMYVSLVKCGFLICQNVFGARGEEVSCQHDAPASLPPGNNPDTHLKGAWVGSRANLGALVKRKISFPLQAPIPGSSNP